MAVAACTAEAVVGGGWDDAECLPQTKTVKARGYNLILNESTLAKTQKAKFLSKLEAWIEDAGYSGQIKVENTKVGIKLTTLEDVPQDVMRALKEIFPKNIAAVSQVEDATLKLARNGKILGLAGLATAAVLSTQGSAEAATLENSQKVEHAVGHGTQDAEAILDQVK